MGEKLEHVPIALVFGSLLFHETAISSDEAYTLYIYPARNRSTLDPGEMRYGLANLGGARRGQTMELGSTHNTAGWSTDEIRISVKLCFCYCLLCEWPSC